MPAADWDLPAMPVPVPARAARADEDVNTFADDVLRDVPGPRGPPPGAGQPRQPRQPQSDKPQAAAKPAAAKPAAAKQDKKIEATFLKTDPIPVAAPKDPNELSFDPLSWTLHTPTSTGSGSGGGDSKTASAAVAKAPAPAASKPAAKGKKK